MPAESEPFVPLPTAEKRRLIGSTVLLFLAWIVSAAVCFTLIEMVLGPMDDTVVTLDEADIPG